MICIRHLKMFPLCLRPGDMIFGSQMTTLPKNCPWYRVLILSNPLCTFRAEIAFSLSRAGRPARKGRPSLDAPGPAVKIRRCFVGRPTVDVRYDDIGHWLIHADKGHCRHCPKGWTRMKCSKCEVKLCWTPEHNCFVDFHNMCRVNP